MIFGPRPYKISPMYRVLYSCCIDVFDSNKNSLTNYLLIEKFGESLVDKLNKYAFNELIETMIYDFKMLVNDSSYDDAKTNILTMDRINELTKIFNKNDNTQTNVQSITFRIPETLVAEIKYLKKTTLGEVIELSIANFINNIDEQFYELILMSFKHSKFN